MPPLLCSLLLSPQPAAAAGPLPRGFYVLDPSRWNGTSGLRGDYSWGVANVPFVDFPELPDVETAYYYRWRMYKMHIEPTPEGYVVTEFLPKVGQAGKYNTISAAAGHHIAEGRWIHERAPLDNYTTFWWRGGEPRKYTSWLAWAAWQRHMVVGDGAFAASLLPGLLDNARGWTREHRRDYGGRVCWWQGALHDAMEVSISGDGCRPTLNSIMFGEAVALLQMAALAGNASVTAELEGLRDAARGVVLGQLWNPDIASFAVIPLPDEPPAPAAAAAPAECGYDGVLHDFGGVDVARTTCAGGSDAEKDASCCANCRANPACEFWVRRTDTTSCWLKRNFTGYSPSDTRRGNFASSPPVPPPAPTPAPPPPAPPGCQLGPGPPAARGRWPGVVWPQNTTVTVRELLAFMPWYFSLPTAAEGQLVPPAAAGAYVGMWRQLFDPAGFAAAWGLRTAERRSPCYNYSYSHHDCWNGPSWPYETARVLTAAGNMLNDYPALSALSKEEYLALLIQYARQHTRTAAARDTAVPPGSGHLFEVLHPDDGYWINRDAGSDVGYDYNHSTFIDLILSGLLGLRPRPDNVVVLNPLAPLGSLSHFAADHILYHGRYISVVWDADGTHYGVGAGLRLMVDGAVAASRAQLGQLTASL